MSGGWIRNFAVAIPFHVGDAGVSHQERVDRRGDVHCGHIEHELVAFLARGDTLQVQGGGGCLLIEPTDGADHLGLDPDAEVDAAGAGVFCQGGEAVREFAGIGGPIAQGAGVVISLAEPAIIQHKHFSAQIGGSGDELAQGGFIDIEVHTLPAVEEGAARFHAVGDDAAAQVAVHAAAGVACAQRAESEDGGGKLQRVLRLQQVGAVGKVVPHGEQQVAVDAALELHVVVAAPGQRAQQAEAMLFLRAVGSQAQQKAGGAFLGCFDAGGRVDADGIAGGNGLLLHVVLSRP